MTNGPEFTPLTALPAFPREDGGQFGMPPAPAPARPADTFGFKRLMASALRLKWVVVGVTAAGTVLGLGVARRIQPMYAAKATLWVDVQDVRLRDQGPIQTGQPIMGPTGWMDLLKSRVVMDAVVSELRLYLALATPADSAVFADFAPAGPMVSGAYTLAVDATGREFTLSTVEGEVLQRDTVGAPVGAALGWAWRPAASELKPGRAIAFQVIGPDAAADRLAGSVRVRTDMEGKVGNFLRIELRGPDPAFLAVVTNEVADRFVEVAADLKREKLIGLTHILESQLEQAQKSLSVAEGQLRAFRVRNAPELARSSAGVARDPAAGALFELQGSREQLRRDRETIERLLAEAGDGPMSVEGLGMIASVGRSAEFKQALDELTNKQTELRALRYRYTDEHLPVQRLAAEVATLERQTIPALARMLVSQLAARDSEMRRQIDSAGGSLRSLPAVALEDGRLQRNVQIAEGVFSSIQTRYEEARLAAVSTLPEVRVLDRAAQPQAPVYSARALVVVLGFFGSFAAGLIGAVVLDQVDPRLRYPEEVTRRMGLPILGAVPHAGSGAAAHAVASVVERSSKLISAVRRTRKALPAGNVVEVEGGNGTVDAAAAAEAKPAPAISTLGRLSAAVRSSRVMEAIAEAVPSLSPNQAAEAVNQAVEALRGIRLNLVHAYGTAGPLVVTVTSPGRGDGKSFVSSNLALAFADAGHRTLLIDGDTRRGALHRVLEARRTPGLIDLLSGQADKAETVQETSYPRLSFIGCGTRVSHGPELLGSPTMQRFMADLRASYDVIVVDSPPLAAGIDALILGTLSGGMLLVLRAGVTDRQLAEAKLDALDRLPIRMLGAVINDVPAQGAYRYYSYYLSGYEIDEEQEKEKAGSKG